MKGGEKRGKDRKGGEEEMQQSVLVNFSLLTLQKGPRLPPSAWNNLSQTHTHSDVHAHAPFQMAKKKGLMIFQHLHTISQNPSLQFLQEPRRASMCVCVCVYISLWRLKVFVCVCKCLCITWVCVMSGAPYVPHKFVFTPKKAHPYAY